jgi:hypothetical protein
MTSSWHSLIPLLSFPAAANSEDSTQFGSVPLQLLNSQSQFSNLSCSFKLAPLYRRVTDLQKTFVTSQNSWREPHRKQRFLYCCDGMFTVPLHCNRSAIVACTCVAGIRLPSHYLVMGIHVKIQISSKVL